VFAVAVLASIFGVGFYMNMRRTRALEALAKKPKTSRTAVEQRQNQRE